MIALFHYYDDARHGRARYFLGIFSTEERCAEAEEKYRERQKSMGYPMHPDYEGFEREPCELDSFCSSAKWE